MTAVLSDSLQRANGQGPIAFPVVRDYSASARHLAWVKLADS